MVSPWIINITQDTFANIIKILNAAKKDLELSSEVANWAP
jgi:hypothetical protein